MGSQSKPAQNPSGSLAAVYSKELGFTKQRGGGGGDLCDHCCCCCYSAALTSHTHTMKYSFSFLFCPYTHTNAYSRLMECAVVLLCFCRLVVLRMCVLMCACAYMGGCLKPLPLSPPLLFVRFRFPLLVRLSFLLVAPASAHASYLTLLKNWSVSLCIFFFL